MRLQLATKQVMRLFGPRPHLGRKLPETHIHTTCGIEWYRRRIKTTSGEWIPVGEGYFRPHKVTKNATIALQPVYGKPNTWDLVVAPEFEPIAMMWLANNFENVTVVG